MNIFVYTYPLSASYIPIIVRLFLYATKHVSNTNGIQTAPLGVGGQTNIIEQGYEKRKDNYDYYDNHFTK